MTGAMKAAVIEAEKARCRALIAADPKAMSALFDDGFTYTHSNGRVESRGEYLETLGKRMRYNAANHTDVDARFFGDVAVLTGNLDLVQQPPDGPARDIFFRFLSVWRKSGDSWLAIAHQNTKRTN